MYVWIPFFILRSAWVRMKGDVKNYIDYICWRLYIDNSSSSPVLGWRYDGSQPLWCRQQDNSNAVKPNFKYIPRTPTTCTERPHRGCYITINFGMHGQHKIGSLDVHKVSVYGDIGYILKVDLHYAHWLYELNSIILSRTFVRASFSTCCHFMTKVCMRRLPKLDHIRSRP